MRNPRVIQSIYALLGYLVLVQAGCSVPTVEIANGVLRGGQCASGDLNYLLSVPYAVPPLGNLRFTPP